MKRLILIMCIMVIGVSTGSAQSIGMASGNLWTADAVGFGNGYLGFNGGLGSDVSAGFVSLSYGFSEVSEGRVKVGFADPDFEDGRHLLLSFEAKYEILDFANPETNHPFDLAAGGMFEIVYYERLNAKEYTAFAIVSMPYRFNSGRGFVVYSRLNGRVEVLSPRHRMGEGETDYRVGLNAGVKINLINNTNVYCEMQFDGNSGLYFGLDFKAL